MRQKELETPFGKIYMYKNGKRINFEVEYYDYGMYLNNNTIRKPQGIYKLYPNMEELAKGDIIICEFDQGHLQYDGGDEFMLNIVGTCQGYTVGMGVPDSDDIERHDSQRKRVLPYETKGKTESGFEIHILDDPKGYSCENDFQKLHFVVAWEPGTADEDWNLISFVTC